MPSRNGYTVVAPETRSLAQLGSRGDVAKDLKSETSPGMRHYDANYLNFESELYEQIRRDAFGEDIGQSSWITADEQDRFLHVLNLAPGKSLLDVACGSG